MFSNGVILGQSVGEAEIECSTWIRCVMLEGVDDADVCVRKRSHFGPSHKALDLLDLLDNVR